MWNYFNWHFHIFTTFHLFLQAYIRFFYLLGFLPFNSFSASYWIFFTPFSPIALEVKHSIFVFASFLTSKCNHFNLQCSILLVFAFYLLFAPSIVFCILSGFTFFSSFGKGLKVVLLIFRLGIISLFSNFLEFLSLPILPFPYFPLVGNRYFTICSFISIYLGWTEHGISCLKLFFDPKYSSILEKSQL